MKRKQIICLFITGLALLFTHNLSAQNICSQPPTQTRVLLVGDSWAQFMWLQYNSYRKIFAQFGYPDILEKGDRTAISGTRANQWYSGSNMTTLMSEIRDNPSIDIVVISLGGNDLINGFEATMDSTEIDELMTRIQGHMQIIVDSIKSARPGLEILINSYDYLNFVETITDFPSSFLFPQNPFISNWNSMGQPDVQTVNLGLSLLALKMIEIANNDPQVFFVNNLGLNHHVFGYPTVFPLPPGGTFPPGESPLPGQAPDYSPLQGGYPDYPSHRTAMGPIPIINLPGWDPIHMSGDAYYYFVKNQYKYYFLNKFQGNPTQTFTSQGDNFDGWADENGNTGTGEIRMGANPSGSVTGIISFNTADLPDDAEITEATLFINRAGLTGANPIGGQLGETLIDIKSGTFGSEALEAGDWNETADAENVGCFIGNASADEHTIRIELQPQAFEFLNKNGITQFRIRFANPGSSERFLSFNTGSATKDFAAPKLSVHHTGTVGVAPTLSNKNSLRVFPNPANDNVKIQLSSEISGDATLTVQNLLGQTLLRQQVNLQNGLNEHSFNIGQLSSGIYLVAVESKGMREVKKLVVER